VTVIVGWEGSAADAPHFAAIQDEILRAALSEISIVVHTIGYEGDASDPLWRLGERWRIDPPGSAATARDFDVQLVPLARPPLNGRVLTGRVTTAMRARIPVIATERWPLRALIVDGVTGVLIPANRPREWNRAILRLAGDAVLREAMGEAAANRAASMRRTRGRGRP